MRRVQSRSGCDLADTVRRRQSSALLISPPYVCRAAKHGGQSTSVNKVTIPGRDGHGLSLLLQLLSGDELAIEANYFEINRD